MNRVRSSVRTAGAKALGLLAAGLVLSGCGMPGAPLPPSLNLPDPVMDLTATRTGGEVALTWTMPKKNTDKLLLKGNVPVRVCRKEGSASGCVQAGTLQLVPGTVGAFTDTLPDALAAGAPRALSYFVELKNRNGRSAGMSNGAVVVAGEAPAPVTGLVAEVRKEGIVLHWTAGSVEPASIAVRLHRTLLTPLPVKKDAARQNTVGGAGGLMAPPPEPVEQNLLVERSGKAGRALGRTVDEDIRFGETYEYRAQRVARITVDGKTMELAGPLSAPVRIEAADVFPPAVPEGLAAVATAGENGGAPAIDLSWQPDTEADLAGYAVYRREVAVAGEGSGMWQRISPAQPVVGPAFHDAHVEAGHTYSYAVSAIDQGGHESGRSAEARETVAGP